MRPVIGITSYAKYFGEETQTAYFAVRETYPRAIAAAGGAALILPPMADEAQIAALLGVLDGLLFTGGTDIDPARYNADRHPATQQPDLERDASEIALVHAAMARDIPVLGICRGMQIINVALGGTLYQDLAAEYGAAQSAKDLPPHPHGSWKSLVHDIRVAPDSRLGAILGTTHAVNSLHHQGIRTAGRGLRVVAQAEDGVPEGLEDDHQRILAVQFHPEELYGRDEGALGLFADLVARAQHFHAERMSAGATR